MPPRDTPRSYHPAHEEAVTMDIDLSTGTPPDRGRTIQLAEFIAEAVRCLNHATMDHGALGFPADADRLVREIGTAVSRLPQLLSQVTRWVALEDEAARIGVPSGEWQGCPRTAAAALAIRADVARMTAETLSADLEAMARVTSALAGPDLEEEGSGE